MIQFYNTYKEQIMTTFQSKLKTTFLGVLDKVTFDYHNRLASDRYQDRCVLDIDYTDKMIYNIDINLYNITLI